MSPLSCRYGKTCFRLNTNHLVSFRHEHLEQFLVEIKDGKPIEEVLRGMSEDMAETISQQLQVIQSMETASSKDQSNAIEEKTSDGTDSDETDSSNDEDEEETSEDKTETRGTILQLPPSNERYDLTSPKYCQGVVSTMIQEGAHGTIRILPYDSNLKEIGFDFEDVKNAASVIMDLKVGSRIYFEKGFHDPTTTTNVIIYAESNQEIVIPSKEEAQFLLGTVISMDLEAMSGTLKCSKMETEIHLDLRKHFKFGIRLKCGDQVTFHVDGKTSQPSVSCARVIRYEATRTTMEMRDFLNSSLEVLQSTRAASLITELTPQDSFWQYLGSFEVQKDHDLIWKILKFVTVFFQQNRSNADLSNILEILAQPSNVLDKVTNLESNLVDDNFQTVFELFEQVIEKCPSGVINIFPLMKIAPKSFVEKMMIQLVGKGTSCSKDAQSSDNELEKEDIKVSPKVKLVSRYLNCGHEYRSASREDISNVVCNSRCSSRMTCESQHLCRKKCGESHDHLPTSCEVRIDYIFPDCQHPSPLKKKCGEKITWRCSYELKFLGACGHPLFRKCFEKEESIMCRLPCENKNRSCGHPCFNKCGKNCDTGECELCMKDVNTFRRNARKKASELKEKLGKENFLLTDLKNSDAQYLTVEDQVTKYVQAMHNWSPTVTRIQLVKNLEREIAYEHVKANGFGSYEDLKFHGTSEEGVVKIPMEGFREPGARSSNGRLKMFGAGIYFATDSSKSAQHMYTKNSNKLLLCQVFLGKCLRLEIAKSTMNLTKLREMKFDSVFAPRGSAVKNDEFVVYDRDQAYAKYIIHFHSTRPLLNVPPAIKSDSTSRMVLKPSHHFNISNPDDLMYRLAESAFFRNGQANGMAIKSVEFVTNVTLSMDFQNKKADFKKKGIPDDEILAFFEANSDDVEEILTKNLTDFKTHPHGSGVYFSEHPSSQIGYGSTLMLFKILPGKEYDGSKKSWPNFQSKFVSNGTEGPIIIVANPKQFLPICIYNLN